MTVYLVGSGPGDPGLITVRAAELVRTADVIVHDRLVDERVLALAPAGTPMHDVGKRPGGAIEQEAINELLVMLATRYRRVVRLKGGDPLVFGRGGEEALALAQAGVEFEIVPGVSSVNGVLAYAGIPVTHRGVSASCTIVAGHAAGSSGSDRAAVDWDAVARVGGTIVVLMGVAQRREIAARLIAAGRDRATPTAVVERGTSGAQRTTRTTLGRLGESHPGTPAIIVVGDVAALDLAWFERRPLFGWRVAVTRSRQQASVLADRLREAGAEPLEVPTIEIGPPSDGGEALRTVLGRIAEFDWVAFSSANAVGRVFAELNDARDLASTKVAAIGKATAAALAGRGIRADLVPGVAVAEELAAAFGPAPPGGASVLLPQAAGAREALAAGLEALGYRVEAVEAYRTTNPGHDAAAAARLGEAHAVCFSSSSTVEGFVASYGLDALPPVVVTIGPITSASAHKLGVPVDAEAAESSIDGVVEALVRLAAGGATPRAQG